MVARPCANCSGEIESDGYCLTCGTKAPTERDHYTEHPARWVAACATKRIRHFRNEDAPAVAADPDGSGRAALVVAMTGIDIRGLRCGQLGGSPNSCRTSMAAAKQDAPRQSGNRATSVEAAAAAADAAVIDQTAKDSNSAASCTFAAAVVEDDLIVFGNVNQCGSPDRGSSAGPARAQSRRPRWRRPASPWAFLVRWRRTGRKHTPSPSGCGAVPRPSLVRARS